MRTSGQLASQVCICLTHHWLACPVHCSCWPNFASLTHKQCYRKDQKNKPASDMPVHMASDAPVAGASLSSWASSSCTGGMLPGQPWDCCCIMHDCFNCWVVGLSCLLYLSWVWLGLDFSSIVACRTPCGLQYGCLHHPLICLLPSCLLSFSVS